MDSFKGFLANKDQATPIPAEFFSSILPRISNIYELKTILYILWYLDHVELEYPYITLEQLRKDKLFLSGMGPTESEQIENLHQSIQKAVEYKVILDVQEELNTGKPSIYLVNNQLGIQALKLLENGSLRIMPESDSPVKLGSAKPNTYQLYEENIGIITPIIADSLKDLEEIYPLEWIEEAIKEAIKNNVRKLRYIEVILKNWQEEGKDERTDRRRSQKNSEEYDPDRYIDGEFSDFIDH